MGLVLDLAVTAIAAVVVGSLAALTWTIAVSSVGAVRAERRRVAAARRSVATLERRLRRWRDQEQPIPIDPTPGDPQDA